MSGGLLRRWRQSLVWVAALVALAVTSGIGTALTLWDDDKAAAVGVWVSAGCVLAAAITAISRVEETGKQVASAVGETRRQAATAARMVLRQGDSRLLTLRLSARVVEGAQEEADENRRDLGSWIVAVAVEAIGEDAPLGEGWQVGGALRADVPLEVSVPGNLYEAIREQAAQDDRTPENWLEALVEYRVRDAEPLIMGSGPSYYDGGRKKRY